MELDFYKLHLNGHDFILVNMFRQPLPVEEELLPALVHRMCDRRKGVGGRGVLFLYPGEEHQGMVKYFDSLGEEKEIPGDALLCASRYAFDFGLADRGTTVLENGEKALSSQCIDGVHFRHSLDTPLTAEGEPIEEIDDADLSVRVRLGSRALSGTPISFRFPNAAIYTTAHHLSEGKTVEDIDTQLEKAEKYSPVGYQVYTKDEMTVFFPSEDTGDAVEGAAAAATAAVLGGFCERDIVIHYKGGKFLYEWNEKRNMVFITGNPAYVFTGVYELDEEGLDDE